MGKKGVTLLEIILVILIAGIGTGLVYPKVQRSIENQEAKKALETLRTMTQAMRLYQLEYGDLKSRYPTPSNNPIQLRDLDEDGEGYLNSNQYAPGFIYQVQANQNPPRVRATNQRTGRRVTVFLNPGMSSQDGAVTDTAGFLSS